MIGRTGINNKIIIFENIKDGLEEILEKFSLTPDELTKTLDVKCKKY